jgi:Skp family chaperone for outer membrane proteins
MSKQEVHELHEHAREVEHNPQLLPVTITMSILAVFIAADSLFGHRSHTEELLNQTKATDQWAFYQAKNIRRHADEQFADLLGIIELKDKEEGEKLRESYKKEAERYKEEQKEIENEAKKLEDETKSEQRKADRFDLGEILLEAALVVTSMTLLTKLRMFWFTGIVIGLIGILVGVTGFLIH